MVKRVFVGCFTLIFGVGYGVAAPAPVDQHKSGGVFLVRSASSGQSMIVLNDSTGISDPTKAIRIQSPDGSTQETHYVYTFNGNTVALNAPLANSFPKNSTVTPNPGGMAAGPKHGVAAGPPGWLASSEGGRDVDTAAIAILTSHAIVAIIALATAGN